MIGNHPSNVTLLCIAHLIMHCSIFVQEAIAISSPLPNANLQDPYIKHDGASLVSLLPLLLLPPQPHKLQIHRRRQKRRRQYPRHDQKVPRQARLRLKLNVVIPNGPLLALPPAVILSLMRPRVAGPVKVRHVLVSVVERVGPRAHAAVVMRLVESARVPGVGAVRLRRRRC